MSRFWVVFSIFWLGFAAEAAVSLEGADLFSGTPAKIAFAEAKKGTVIVFVSAKCPCSTSHHKHLKQLSLEFSDFQFVGVHSNSDEPLDFAREHLKDQLGFRILQDDKAVIADEFKAFKTPHVFVVNQQGKILYRGGVSNSAVFDRSDKFFLKEALEDARAELPLRRSEGRTLGCIITRAQL